VLTLMAAFAAVLIVTYDYVQANPDASHQWMSAALGSV
jgi:hypothetical protein